MALRICCCCYYFVCFVVVLFVCFLWITPSLRVMVAEQGEGLTLFEVVLSPLVDSNLEICYHLGVGTDSDSGFLLCIHTIDVLSAGSHNAYRFSSTCCLVEVGMSGFETLS